MIHWYHIVVFLVLSTGEIDFLSLSVGVKVLSSANS